MFLRNDYNPFAARTFHASEDFQKFLSDNSRAQGEEKSKGVQGVPFVRMVDGWLLAAAIGAASVDLSKELSENKAKNFAQGSVLQRDQSAIEFMMLLAIGITGDSKVIEDPIRVTKIIWQCAEAGYPALKSLVESGGFNRTENLSNQIMKFSLTNVNAWKKNDK